MNYKYKDTSKWRKKGFKSLGNVAVVIGSNILTMTSMDTGPLLIGFVQTVTVVFTIIGVTRAVHYFTRPEKDYVVVDDQGVLIDRGPFQSKKEIPLQQIRKLVEREEVLVVDQKAKADGLINDVEREKSLAFEQHNSKETLIDLDNITSQDVQRLKQEMKERVGTTAEVL
ncbi:hypothetical protein [Salimicrobium halophilum]|uniref:Uncharacterized protein n=1 Tax=Salimicrobium halophilum TaxID=86666 RepID=A0A1G8R8Y0_9BACI|nr:hypothetical protein [Salimicrobium halophilum]SDJ13411.1 hypothetical protein SAMN04490247_0897 [Salimicrobium halophilum]